MPVRPPRSACSSGSACFSARPRTMQPRIAPPSPMAVTQPTPSVNCGSQPCSWHNTATCCSRISTDCRRCPRGRVLSASITCKSRRRFIGRPCNLRPEVRHRRIRSPGSAPLLLVAASWIFRTVRCSFDWQAPQSRLGRYCCCMTRQVPVLRSSRSCNSWQVAGAW